MEQYTVQGMADGRQRAILVYKSGEAMAFPDPGSHTIRRELGDTTTIETYVCEPYVYREIPPGDSEPYYYYWFLVDHVDTQTIVTNQSQIDEIKSRQEASDLALLGVMQKLNEM